MAQIDDIKVWELLQEARTDGIFQLEGSGMRSLLMRLKPTTIEHICACISLYRPGPLDSGMVDHYVARKNGDEPIPSIHPIADRILAPTYGVPCYQETVMMLANQVAGIPLSDAYSLIKAISKKIREKVEAYKVRFVDGCQTNGVTKEGTETLWSVIDASARYLFNRSHAMAYAFIAYQTAYLKAYYPLEFMAALLSCDISQRNYTGRDPLVEHLEDCRRMGIEVSKPDVNFCGPDFSVCDDKITFGLDAVKGVPHSAAVAIRAAQPFTDLFDFCKRVPKSACPRAATRNLIWIGAMPGPRDRASTEKTLDRAMKLAAGEYKDPKKQEGKWSEAEPFTRAQELALEREHTGIYISGHPTDAYPVIALLGDVRAIPEQETVLAGGVVSNIETRFTHKVSKKFVTFLLESRDFSTECLIWEPHPKIMANVKDGQVVIVRGQVNRRGPNNTMTCRSIRSPNEYLAEHNIGVCVDIPWDAGWGMKKNAVVNVAMCHLGGSQLLMRVGGHAFWLALSVTLSGALLADLRAAIGNQSVYLTETKV